MFLRVPAWHVLSDCAGCTGDTRAARAGHRPVGRVEGGLGAPAAGLEEDSRAGWAAASGLAAVLDLRWEDLRGRRKAVAAARDAGQGGAQDGDVVATEDSAREVVVVLLLLLEGRQAQEHHRQCV